MASLPKVVRAGSPAFSFTLEELFVSPGATPRSSMPAAQLLRTKMTGQDLISSPDPSSF
jgi:hypothetical protein